MGLTLGYADRTAEEIREYDRVREKRIRAKGFVVHRIWAHETRDLVILEERIRLIANAQRVVAV